MSQTSKLRRCRVISERGCRCHYCGIKMEHHKITIDHIIPSSCGGTNDFSNLVASCRPCNSAKGNRSIQWFRLHLGLAKSKYYGVINVDQAVSLIDLGLNIDIPSHRFYFEELEVSNAMV